MTHRATSTVIRSAALFALALVAACATAPEPTIPQAPSPSFAAEASPEPPAAAAPSPAVPKPVEPAPAPTAAVVVVTAPATPVTARITSRHRNVNVRQHPGSHGRPVAVLRGGAPVTIVAKERKWVKIRWEHRGKAREGWIYGKYVEEGR
ncbi:hypothetical protein GURASL_36490 [Geotalea uraniireducens]|uniref:SH3b domain-containing protein n=1 Tax=Geotalea uraniireducens TaxID=351604 RepID=A0ABM8EQG2_9BACT|nr:SH3 domain-containing protein [Geotalea uraniireducens]BDV44726.1 hypothetical protein GURASL_36490 [Geotalea uraniireducens]